MIQLQTKLIVKDGKIVETRKEMLRDLIILVVMDSVRHDQFVEADTPNIDEGGFQEYSQARAGAGWTVPSVMNMMTGRLPHQNGIEQIFPSCYWLPQLLHENGVSTHYMSAMGIPVHMIKYEWDTFYDASVASRGKERNASTLIKKALHVIEDFPNPKKFIFIQFEETHSPYNHAESDKTEWDSDRIAKYMDGMEELDEEYLSYLKERQRGCITYLDKVLKPLIDAECTMVITSDHGDYFGEHHLIGHDVPLTETLLHVPLLVRI